jgi:hypothetical protein
MDKGFKMEDVRTVSQLAEDGDWACTLDIASAYLHILVQPDFQPFLSFQFGGNFYCYTAMPFGLKCAPRVFTLIMRRIIDYLRTTLSLRCVIYMDDLLILGTSSEMTMRLTQQVVARLLELGWTLSWEKCQLTPAQLIEFVGWQFNFQTMTVQMTRHRRWTLMQEVQRFQQAARERQTLPVRQLAALLGQLNFLRLQCAAASL